MQDGNDPLNIVRINVDKVEPSPLAIINRANHPDNAEEYSSNQEEHSDYVDENFEEDETDEIWGLDNHEAIERKNKSMKPHEMSLKKLDKK